MELLNADGSSAEMSGNGIRCLAQAVFQAGLAEPPRAHRAPPTPACAPCASCRRSGPRTHRMSVEMGQAKVVGQEPEWVEGDVLERHPRRRRQPAPRAALGRRRAARTATSWWRSASRIDGATPGGANVEIVAARRHARRARHGRVRARRRPHPGVRHRRLRGRRRRPRVGAVRTARTVVHMPGGPVEISARRSRRAHRRRHLRRHPRHAVAVGGDRMSLIERSFREKIVLVGRHAAAGHRRGHRGRARRALRARRHRRRRRGRAASCSAAPRPIRPPTSARARPRSCASWRWRPTATPSCSTTSSPRRSSATSRSCSGAPPSTAPR